MNWKEFQESSPRTLPSLLNTYGLNEILNPSILQYLSPSLEGSIRNIGFKIDMAHMAMGLSSELVELNEAIEKGDLINIEEELVDILWYVSGTIHILKTKRAFILPEVSNYNDNDTYSTTRFEFLTCYVSDFTDIPKKMLAYKREVVAGEKPSNASKEFYYESEIDKALYKIVVAVKQMMNTYKCNFERGLQNNQDKLRARFPEKFTEEFANNRNLDKERKELEKD